jgi:hypothetical protein
VLRRPIETTAFTFHVDFKLFDFSVYATDQEFGALEVGRHSVGATEASLVVDSRAGVSLLR